MDFLTKICADETVKLYVNRRLVVSSVLMALACSILIYLIFSRIKGVNGVEEMILLIFLAAFVLRPFFRLLNVMPTIELRKEGIAYRGDFQPWHAVFEAEVVRSKFKLASNGRLMLYTKIKDKKELAWDITAYDSNIDLAELLKLIEFCTDEFGQKEVDSGTVSTEKPVNASF